jgi:hypothetical protein
MDAGSSAGAGNCSAKPVTISITTRTVVELSTKPTQRSHLRYIIYINTRNPMTDSQKTTLEMLTAREQLMEDIDAIVTSQYLSDKIDEDDMEDLIVILCDAVCANFPVK